jgi:hypothetical protein
MELPRRTRAEETRETEARIETWKPPSTLPDPDPRPGFTHRWCAVTVNGEVALTINKRLSEGWTFCKPEDYPEVTRMIYSPNKDRIETGGQVLCRAPKALMQSRAEYHHRVSTEQLTGVRQANANTQQDVGTRLARFAEDDLKIQSEQGRKRDLSFGDGK